ncbi:hypothetical protein BN1002_04537 [Bacillus sp. B-jedd]|nr:hypothetical protein BN1002_04537 [Bacillus sp. B-jedd]
MVDFHSGHFAFRGASKQHPEIASHGFATSTTYIERILAKSRQPEDLSDDGLAFLFFCLSGKSVQEGDKFFPRIALIDSIARLPISFDPF